MGKIRFSPLNVRIAVTVGQEKAIKNCVECPGFSRRGKIKDIPMLL